MGVVDFYNCAAFGLVKSNTINLQQVGLASRASCSFEGNQRKFVAMASTIPAEQLNKGPLQVTGDSFVREHLRKLAPYQPILPFEVALIKVNFYWFCLFPLVTATLVLPEVFWALLKFLFRNLVVFYC